MSYLVANPEDRFSRDKAHMSLKVALNTGIILAQKSKREKYLFFFGNNFVF